MNLGSKKKARRQAYLGRQKIKADQFRRNKRLQDALRDNDIETAARIMGVKL